MLTLKQTLSLFALVLVVVLGLAVFAPAASEVYAQSEDCQGVELGVGVGCDPASTDENVIYTYLRAIVQFLSAGIGLIIVLMIVVSGVQYIASAGNPDTVKAAKKRLNNAVIALVLFIFMAAILNFLVPGGLL